MKLFRHFFAGLFAAIVFIAPLHAAETNNYIVAGQFDFIALLTPPPLPDSPEQAADLAEVRAVFQSAPSNDVALALSENKGVELAYFQPVVGDALLSGKLPKTEAFLKRVHKDAEIIVDASKDYWKRPRPYMTDPTLIPGGKLQKSFSYPSGHSTESMTLALVLAELFPEKRDALIAEARAIGWHRVEIARHYPTDIYAGRVLAQAIVRAMKENPNFQRDIAAAKAEIAATPK